MHTMVEQIQAHWQILRNNYLPNFTRQIQTRRQNKYQPMCVSRIATWIVTRPKKPHINLLPNELLVYILEFVIKRSYSDSYPGTQRTFWRLLNVCRYWNDIVTDTPSLWSTVNFSWSVSFVKAHVKRSGGHLLNVEIVNVIRPRDGSLRTYFDLIVASAPRWHSLLFYNLAPASSSVLQCIYGLRFPSLKYVSMTPIAKIRGRHTRVRYPRFLCGNSPCLRTLSLFFIDGWDDPQVPPGLVSLELGFLNRPASPASSSLLTSSSLQKLKVLSLIGNISAWTLLPNSIHLPSLEKLGLSVDTNAGSFLRALVIPRLKHIRLGPPDTLGLHPDDISELRSKFSNIQRLHLNYWWGMYNMWAGQFRREDTKVMYKVFPGIRHVKMWYQCTYRMFFWEDGSCIADRWDHLEGLTFEGPIAANTNVPEDFIFWLKQRNNVGKPRMQVELEVVHRFQGMKNHEYQWLNNIHELLGAYTDLKFIDC
ncbi:hypothetical protein J3A83DRAFT_1998491 [Scleroderma citrinum]